MNTIPNMGLLAILTLPAAALAQGRVGALAQAQETFNEIGRASCRERVLTGV